MFFLIFYNLIKNSHETQYFMGIIQHNYLIKIANFTLMFPAIKNIMSRKNLSLVIRFISKLYKT